MSETKTPWTEGPWSVSHPGNGVRVEYEGEYRNDGWVIAELLGPDAEANARLIASAPDLYEACALLEAAEDHYHNECDECGGEGEPELCSTCFPLFDDARLARRAALALAKGETK